MGAAVGYSLSISGNDGRHPDVVSKVTVEFLIFSNATIDNSVTLQIIKLTANDFLSQYYRALLDLLQRKIDVGDKLTIFSIGENGPDLNVYLAVESPQGKLKIYRKWIYSVIRYLLAIFSIGVKWK